MVRTGDIGCCNHWSCNLFVCSRLDRLGLVNMQACTITVDGMDARCCSPDKHTAMLGIEQLVGQLMKEDKKLTVLKALQVTAHRMPSTVLTQAAYSGCLSLLSGLLASCISQSPVVMKSPATRPGCLTLKPHL